MDFVFRPELMMDVLPIMGIGMLGIFLVTGILIACAAFLNKIPCDSLTTS